MSELCPSGDVPKDPAQLVRDSVVCDDTGELVKMDDPARLTLCPSARSWHDPEAAHQAGETVPDSPSESATGLGEGAS